MRRFFGARRGRFTALLLAGSLSVLSTPLSALDQRAQAEIRLQAINEEIQGLQATLAAQRGRQRSEQEQLNALDLELQQTALLGRELQAQIEAQQQEIASLRARQSAYISQLEQREDALGAQVVAAWRLSRQSRLKLIMNQDDPAKLNRLLAYYDYFNSAQSSRIGGLRSSLAELDAMSEAIDAELARLAEVESLQLKQLAELDQRRNNQANLLERLETGLDDAEVRLDELQRNRQDLEQLLERLDNALADIPADIGGRIHPRALKGQLPMPVQGPVTRAFGQNRSAGLQWQGWLMQAEAGTPINAVAYGRVAYADWLRGYGLLLIIDHGDGFMSLYGHNESLLVEVGDWVQAEQAIATAGRQSGQPAGLYFELRNNGSALDPAVWINRR